MPNREQDHQHSYVGTASPDADGDTGDRTLTDQGDPSAQRRVDPVERAEKRAQLAESEDVQGRGGAADPSASDRDLVDGGPTQAGGTVDEAPDPTGRGSS